MAMWNLHDVDVDALWDVLHPVYSDRESAVFAGLAAWFENVGRRVPVEFVRGAITTTELEEFEKWLEEMQRELLALSSARGVLLASAVRSQSAALDRVVALIAELGQNLQYLAAHPLFSNEAAGARAN